MKIICCTGDSHTWGQGAKGAVDGFTPGVICGDLRPTCFTAPHYVNLLRNEISKKTNSVTTEYSAELLADFSTKERKMQEGCVIIDEIPLQMKIQGGFFRIILHESKECGSAEIYLDDQMICEMELHATEDQNAYRTLSFSAKEGRHTLKLNSKFGAIAVYRIECYSGEAAVINCGVGSCTSERYLEQFWDPYVEAVSPTVVIIEAHTINDWIAAKSPKDSEENLLEMISRTRELGAAPILLSVSPILNEQMNKNGIDYEAYVEASRNAAKRSGCMFADANTVMKELLRGYSDSEKKKMMFDDEWHVNDFGHQIYAETILKQQIKL